MIRFASLGSGSKGNALLVESGCTRVLVDCGFGQREMALRLERLGIEPASVDAVLVTHEHADHVG
ncbi:MAG: MBL fold metallo-hydrolase, partial [Rhodocyclaceae bacterium]|nr:MBL fold metallo-hydrolase [Rhodocyclaceae bacterium]